MKYWGYLAAKLIGAAALLGFLWPQIRRSLPDADKFRRHEYYQMGDNLLWYTLGVYLFWLFAAGLLYLIIRDQRYRCRTCLRKLRMPIARGSWSRLLIGRPHTEYICPYGHGTLKVPEIHITGNEPHAWAEHKDIWKELETLSAGKD
jgi:hypothetical protein